MPIQLVMKTQKEKKPWWIYLLRWLPRISAFALFAISFKEFMFLMSLTSGLREKMLINLPYTYVFIFYIIGFIVGFWSERLGSLFCLLGCVYLIIIDDISIVNAPIIFILLLPSLLYILSWFLNRRWERQSLRSKVNTLPPM